MNLYYYYLFRSCSEHLEALISLMITTTGIAKYKIATAKVHNMILFPQLLLARSASSWHYAREL
jgi:hypothetical protein